MILFNYTISDYGNREVTLKKKMLYKLSLTLQWKNLKLLNVLVCVAYQETLPKRVCSNFWRTTVNNCHLICSFFFLQIQILKIENYNQIVHLFYGTKLFVVIVVVNSKNKKD